ncbi:hypothetical protein ZEAMMB73_Zm00001d021262 [Zea mays]|uniref:Thioredoxin domain-containing protein n=1 Tax=Zea mays TaxID=4577 RepID=A0A1D6I9E6_MAIZE|nr:hypothetical protein ZEAMMB73_Zm00001d021262 [Zea mays]
MSQREEEGTDHTPQSKAVRPRQELFHSVKHQKESLAAAARKGTVVKSLFMSTTPKKEPVQTPAADKSKGAVSEVCSKLRKLNLACREVPSRYMSQPQPKNTKTTKKSEETTVAKSEKRGLESKTNAKKKILGRSVKRANAGPDGENRNGCSTAADENSLAETAGSHQERKVVLQELRIEVDVSRCGNSDDNKENVSSAPSEEALDNSSHYGSENRLLENNDNVPLKENVALKVAKLQKKVHQEQAGKLKKTTNPRVLRDGWSLLKQLKPNTHSKNYHIHDIVRNFASGVMRTGASPIHLSVVSNGSYGLMESWARVLHFFANVGLQSQPKEACAMNYRGTPFFHVKLMSRFTEAAAVLRAMGSAVAFAKLDGERYPKATAAVGVKGFPTVLLFVNGIEHAYHGLHTK